MNYTSLAFFLFLGAAVTLYYLVPLTARWYVLLTASLFFYAAAGLEFLPFILCSSLLAWGAGLLLEKQTLSPRKKAILTAALALLIGYLAVTKLFRYFAPGSFIIVPLGISYYTFSTVGYLLDVNWKRQQAEKNYLKFLLFTSFFPHIVQGPIPRYHSLAPQLAQGHRFSYQDFTFGLQLMLFGLFQKLVLADRLSLFVSAVFDGDNDDKGLIILAALIFYAIQIYTDFAGCVNICRGAAQLFGITLDENFRQPYFSRSVDEFWRRWHITLGHWFRDYVGIPVSMNPHVKKISRSVRRKRGSAAGKNTVALFALLAVWCCTGLWHGTGLNYLIWALWQGGIIALSMLCRPRFEALKKKLGISDNSRVFAYFQMLRTFILAGLIPRLITRAPSLDRAFVMLKNLFADIGLYRLAVSGFQDYGWDRTQFIIACIAILIQLMVSLMKESDISIRKRVAALPLPIRWVIYLGALFFVIIFGMYGPGFNKADFVYADF